MTHPDLIALAHGATWVFTGDSITQGVHHTHGSRSWVELVGERIRWELDRLMDVVVNTGVSGWTAPQIAAEYEHLVARFTPRVLSVSLGTNDALDGAGGLDDFRKHLAEITRRGVDAGAFVLLHTPVLTLQDAPRTRREWLPAYADTVRTIADREGATLVDHEAHWNNHFGSGSPTPWMDDHTHPNAVGHRQIADTTFRTLGLGPLSGRS